MGGAGRGGPAGGCPILMGPRGPRLVTTGSLILGNGFRPTTSAPTPEPERPNIPLSLLFSGSINFVKSCPTCPYNFSAPGTLEANFPKPSRAANVFDPGIGNATKPSMPAISKALLASSVS